MAEIKCPMCGRLNPPELDQCRFCEARLKPLIAPEPPEEPGAAQPPGGFAAPSGPVMPADEPQDWLSELRGGSESGLDDDSEPTDWSDEREPISDRSESQEDTPDWFGRLQSEDSWEESEDRPEGEPPSEEPAVDEGIWGRMDFDAQPPQTPGEKPPAWLAGLSDSQEPGEEEEAPTSGWFIEEPVAGSGDEAELPAWPPEPEEEAIPEEALETKEIPELLADEVLAGEEPGEADVPGWLRDLTGESREEEPREAPASEAGEDEGDFWWKEEAATGREEIETGEVPEWLQSTDQDFPDWPEPIRDEGEPEPAEEAIPGWLQSTPFDQDFLEGQETPPLPGFDAEVEPPAEELDEGAIPDWLQSARFEQDFLEIEEREPVEPSQEPQAGLVEEGELPDWLQSKDMDEAFMPPRQTKDLPEIRGSDEPIEEEVPEGAAPEPGWLRPDDAEPALSLEREDVPDWLRNLQAVQEDDLGEPSGMVFTEMDEEVSIPAGEDEGVPSWLADLRARTPEIPVDITEEKQLGPPVAEQPSFEEEEPEKEPAMPGGLPGWISEISQEEALEAADLEGVEDEIELAPAELPGWLKAMRPVEAVSAISPAKKQLDEGVESAGPLAGMQGVLPAEADITGVARPPTFSAKVQISDNQYRHINLLKSMLDSTLAEQAPRQEGVLRSQRILRWLIAAGLILVILYPLVTGTRNSPPPSLFPPETMAVWQTIIQLPAESKVLVAFDYQPALSAELEAAATAVLDHLMAQRTRLTLVSTSPSGPALAERFLGGSSALQAYAYTHGDGYVNLGFIAGGAAGLLDFAIDPRTMMPMAFNRQGITAEGDLWSLPALQGIRSVSDYSLVLVIVDDPETARAWVEQVNPRLAATPLVMAISAQAEPLVRPYYESIPRQIAGMVTGLSGGASYEQILTRGLIARDYWDAFSNGLLMAEILILVGGAYNIVISYLNRRPAVQVEGEA